MENFTLSPQAWQGLITGAATTIVVVIQIALAGRQTKKIKLIEKDINILTQTTITLSNEKRTALLTYNQKLFSWIYYIKLYFQPQLQKAGSLSPEIIDRELTLFDELMSSTYTADAYCYHDHSFLEVNAQVVTIVHDLKRMLEIYSNEARLLVSEETALKEDIAPEDPFSYITQLKTLTSEFMVKQMEYFKEINNLVSKLDVATLDYKRVFYSLVSGAI